MADSPLGRTLLIANPAAHSGKGAAGTDFARHFLEQCRICILVGNGRKYFLRSVRITYLYRTQMFAK